MPELPEVETVCQALRLALEGQFFQKIRLNRSGLRYPLPENMHERLAGQVVASVARRAKYILIHFTHGLTLVWHLGMSGRVIVEKAGSPSGQENIHDHVIFITSCGQKIIYRDPRRFGFLRLVESGQLEKLSPFDRLGPEPLDDAALSPAIFHARLEKRSVPLKSALLDQCILAGLGNIYVSEALWQARLSPFRLARTLDLNEADRLLGQIRDVLRRAIASGGSSLRDHIQPNGETGYFQHFFKAYGRKGEPCGHCKVTPLVKATQCGRSTFYCPRCQA